MPFQVPRSIALLGAACAALAGAGVAQEQRRCVHMGADWVDAKVVNIGATQCPSTTFKLTIGTSSGGAQITIKYHGCPAYIDTVPGHGELVQKLQKNPVGPQLLNHSRQAYKADCGGIFSAASCKRDGDPTDLPQYVHHWMEEACPVIVGTGKP